MNQSLQKFLLLLAVPASLAGLMLMSGCSQEVSEGAFDSIYNNSFAVTCQNCHSSGGQASHVTLDVSSPSAMYDTLVNVNVQSPSNPSQCQTVRRVESGSASKSYLLGVLSSAYNTNNFAGVSGCRPNTAHLGYVNLSSAEISAIAAWIDAGATK